MSTAKELSIMQRRQLFNTLMAARQIKEKNDPNALDNLILGIMAEMDDDEVAAVEKKVNQAKI